MDNAAGEWTRVIHAFICTFRNSCLYARRSRFQGKQNDLLLVEVRAIVRAHAGGVARSRGIGSPEKLRPAGEVGRRRLLDKNT